MFLSEWREFPSAPCLAEKKLMTARVSMLLKSRASLTYFWACVLPGRAKDLSARRCVRITSWSCTIWGQHCWNATHCLVHWQMAGEIYVLCFVRTYFNSFQKGQYFCGAICRVDWNMTPRLHSRMLISHCYWSETRGAGRKMLFNGHT